MEEKNYTEEEVSEITKQLIYKSILYAAIVVILAIVITCGITYYITVGKKYDNLYSATTNAIENKDEITTAAGAIDDISLVLDAFADVIDKEYIGEISKNKLISSTIKGFVEGIDDEYSEYMTKEEWDEYQSDQLGNYVGIGVYLSMDENDNVVLVGIIKDSPAEEAGLKEEDIIIGVNGESVTGLDTEEVSNKVRGKEGTDVELTIYRNGEEKTVSLRRKAIKVYHVETKMLENNIGYLSLLTFDEGCADEFRNGLEELKAQGATKVIFDLRYNTGGYVDEALEILDMLLDDGQIELITKSADGDEVINKAKGAKEFDLELVVLSNEYSASASEILIGALKDNGRATIVGTKTYGKGVIQNVYMLADGGVLKLTTQEYFTPNNEKINKVGIEPNHKVELTEENLKNNYDAQLEKAKELLK